MPKFALRKLSEVKGKQQFDELLIDDVCQLGLYIQELEDIYEKDMVQIYQIMNRVANLETVSGNKFKEITEKDNDPVKEYEFKHGDLRVYAIKKLGGKIIVLGGYKNRQDKDLRRFRSIKKQFIESFK